MMNLLRIFSILILVCSISICLNGQNLIKKKNSGIEDAHYQCVSCGTISRYFYTTKPIPPNIWSNQTVTSSIGPVTKIDTSTMYFENPTFNCTVYEYEFKLDVCCENCNTDKEYCPDSAVISFTDDQGSCLFQTLDTTEYFDKFCLELGGIEYGEIGNQCDFEIGFKLCCRPIIPVGDNPTIDTLIDTDTLVDSRNYKFLDSINKNMKLMPNPTTTYVEIENLIEGDKIQLIDSAGNSLKSINIYSDSPFRLDLSNLPTGLYFLQRKKEIQKLIKL